MQPIDHNEAVVAWGQLRQFTPQETASRPTLQALVDVGLPLQVEQLFTTIELSTVATLGSEYVAFGRAWNDTYTMCVNLNSGQVYALHKDGKTLAYVNASLTNFLTFLREMTYFRRLHSQLGIQEIEPVDYQHQLDDLNIHYESLDAAAISDFGWWKTILDDLKI